jgi:hypothetical protein
MGFHDPKHSPEPPQDIQGPTEILLRMARIDRDPQNALAARHGGILRHTDFHACLEQGDRERPEQRLVPDMHGEDWRTERRDAQAHVYQTLPHLPGVGPQAFAVLGLVLHHGERFGNGCAGRCGQ